MVILKLIRSKAFDTNGTKGIVYTCALKGRVLNVSSLSFADEPADTLVVDDKKMTLVINCPVEVVKTPYVDITTGETIMGIKVLPAFGVVISEL